MMEPRYHHHHDVILRVLADIGEGHCEAIARGSLGLLDKVAVAKRMKELQRLEKCELTGKYGMQSNGRNSRLWRLA